MDDKAVFERILKQIFKYFFFFLIIFLSHRAKIYNYDVIKIVIKIKIFREKIISVYD